MTARVTATRADGGDVCVTVYPAEGDVVAVTLAPRAVLSLVADLATIITDKPERALEPAQPTLWGAARWGENTDLG
jgi:hypothetical protein